MQKLDVVLVTAEVNLTQQRSYIGSCLRQATLSPNQCEAVVARLSQVMGCLANRIRWAHYKSATIIWIEASIALCRRILRREMRRFGKALEAIGLAETAETCSPFKVRYE